MSGNDRITTKPTPTRKQVEALEEITRPNWNEEVISDFLEKYNVPDLYKKKITSLLEIFIRKEKEDYIRNLTTDIDIVMNNNIEPVDYSVDKNGLFKVIPSYTIYWEANRRSEYVDDKILDYRLGTIVEGLCDFNEAIKNAEDVKTLKYIGSQEIELRDFFNESVKALCKSFGTTECPKNPYQYVFGKQQGGKKQSRKKLKKTYKNTYKNTKRISRK
jgi:hypothetical protein